MEPYGSAAGSERRSSASESEDEIEFVGVSRTPRLQTGAWGRKLNVCLSNVTKISKNCDI